MELRPEMECIRGTCRICLSEKRVRYVALYKNQGDQLGLIDIARGVEIMVANLNMR